MNATATLHILGSNNTADERISEVKATLAPLNTGFELM
jgi:hypothetical protein